MTSEVSPALMVDTNIVVYTHDPRDRVKQEQAVLLLRALAGHPSVALSAQCLTEFLTASPAGFRSR